MSFLRSSNAQILLAALLGLLFGGFLAQWPADSAFYSASVFGLDVAGTLFIGLLKMVLVPLIFCSIVAGIARLQAHTRMHRVWRLSLLCMVTTTALAVALGLLAAQVFAPGAGLQLALFEQAMAQHNPAQTLTPVHFLQQFLGGVLVNPFKAMAEGNILAVVVFALFVGAGLVSGGARFATVNRFMAEAFALVMLVVGWIMRLAPIGIFALLAKLVLGADVAVLGSLAAFAAVVTGTTIFHGLVVLPLLLWVFGRMSPLRFFRGARPALITAFATSSSSATLPVSLACTQQQLGVQPEVAGFVLPMGSQLNMDGTALYEAAAALFVANLVGLELSISQQLVVCLTAMLASMGAPGIPSAGMVTMIMVLQSVGLPAEAVAILLPIDRLLDTVRTVVNVEGDLAISVVVQRHAGLALPQASADG